MFASTPKIYAKAASIAEQLETLFSDCAFKGGDNDEMIFARVDGAPFQDSELNAAKAVFAKLGIDGFSLRNGMIIFAGDNKLALVKTKLSSLIENIKYYENDDAYTPDDPGHGILRVYGCERPARIPYMMESVRQVAMRMKKYDDALALAVDLDPFKGSCFQQQSDDSYVFARVDGQAFSLAEMQENKRSLARIGIPCEENIGRPSIRGAAISQLKAHLHSLIKRIGINEDEKAYQLNDSPNTLRLWGGYKIDSADLMTSVKELASWRQFYYLNAGALKDFMTQLQATEAKQIALSHTYIIPTALIIDLF